MLFGIFSFIDEYLKQTYEHNALVNAINTNSNLSNTDINLLVLEIFFGGIDAVSIFYFCNFNIEIILFLFNL